MIKLTRELENKILMLTQSELELKDEHNHPPYMYPLIMLGLENFGLTIEPAIDFLVQQGMKKSEIRFLDVGAGVGDKVLIAREHFGLKADGLEFQPLYIQRARENGIDLIEGNALDFAHYNAYDIIYTFTPMRSAMLQTMLELKIIMDMRVGGVFAPASGVYGRDFSRFQPNVLEPTECKEPNRRTVYHKLMESSLKFPHLTGGTNDK